MKFWIVTLLEVCVCSFYPTTANGRVIVSFPPETISHMDPRMRHYLNQLSHIDELNDAFTPQLRPESRSETTARGILELDLLLRRSYHHVVFSVVDLPGIGILYRHDCVRNQSVTLFPHPVILDAIFTREAAALGLTRDFLFVSPAAPLLYNTTGVKVLFDMTDDEFSDCVYAGGTVRYTIMELFDDDTIVPMSSAKSTDLFADPKKKYATAFWIGFHLMHQLKRLHAQNIVHGNLDISRLILESVPGDNVCRVQFVPFSAAEWADNTTGSSRENQAWKYSEDTAWMSPWEIADGPEHRYGKKDDVFRAVEIVSWLTMDNDIPPGMVPIGFLETWKTLGPMFDMQIPDKAGLIGDIRYFVFQALNNISRLCRIDTPQPAYDELASLFYAIVQTIAA